MAKKLKTLYFVFTENYGEAEGVFTENGALLDFWSCNDANWREEYFGPFMRLLGFNTVSSDDPKLIQKLEDTLEDL